MTHAAVMPFRLVLPKDNELRLNLYVELREMTKSNRSVALPILNVEAEANLTGGIPRVGDTSMVHRYGRGAI
eukprot:3483752-Pleurochrysis_carterae.AAC.1